MDVDKLAEVDATHQFHGYEILPIDFTQVVGLHNISVDQVGHQLRFPEEIAPEIPNLRVFFADQFHRDRFLEIHRRRFARPHARCPYRPLQFYAQDRFLAGLKFRLAA